MRTSFLSILSLLVLYACNTPKPEKTAPVQPKTADTTAVIEAPKELPSGLSFIRYKFTDKRCDFPELAETEDNTWCNERTVEGLRIALTDMAIAQKINVLLCKEITGSNGNIQSIKQFVTDIKMASNEEGEPEYLQDTYTVSLGDSSSTFLSLNIGFDMYALGAAHGQYGVSVLNVDLKTGNRIGLSDLLVPNYRSALKAIAKKRFLEQNSEEGGWWFLIGEQPFELSETFRMSSKGITFIYQPYEIGPYAAGAPEVFLSLKDIQRLLKENPYIKG